VQVRPAGCQDGLVRAEEEFLAQPLTDANRWATAGSDASADARRGARADGCLAAQSEVEGAGKSACQVRDARELDESFRRLLGVLCRLAAALFAA